MLLALLAALPGCAALPVVSPLFGAMGTPADGGAFVLTSVELSRANHRVVQSNVAGESRGLTLLLFFTVDAPSYTEAFADLARRVPLEGQGARAYANVIHDRTAKNFLLFALTKVTVRADVVEFFEEAPDDAPTAQEQKTGP